MSHHLDIAYFAGGDRLRSRASSLCQDTDYVILQSNPLLHWIPVAEESSIGSNSTTSSDSSLVDPTEAAAAAAATSIPRMGSQRSLSSRCSGLSTSSANQYRSPPTSQRQRPPRRSASLLGSPPASPPSRRSSLEEQVITIPVPTSTGGSRLGRLKDRLLSGSGSGAKQLKQDQDSTPLPRPEESDGESTPLVSELSSPSNSDVIQIASPESSESSDGRQCRTSTSNQEQQQQQHQQQYHCADGIGLVVRESSNSSIGSRSLSRQNARDWENPETPV